MPFLGIIVGSQYPQVPDNCAATQRCASLLLWTLSSAMKEKVDMLRCIWQGKAGIRMEPCELVRPGCVAQVARARAARTQCSR